MRWGGMVCVVACLPFCLFASDKGDAIVKTVDTFLMNEGRDPGVSFVEYEAGLVGNSDTNRQIRAFDLGFKKWLVTFNEMDKMASCDSYFKRVLQDRPGEFIRQAFPQSVDPKSRTIVVSERGYLPGEVVTWRIESKDKTWAKEFQFCPRPIVLKDAAGKLLMQAALTEFSPTSYKLYFPQDPTNRLVEFVSISGKERQGSLITSDGPQLMFYTPGTVGEMGGLADLRLRFQDGVVYEVKLPWGTDLIPYKKGSR